MNYAIVLAAGKGKRFGKEKQFALIRRKPVLYYAIKMFQQSSCVDKIIVAVQKRHLSRVATLIKRNNFSKVSALVIGGKHRQDSVHNALKALPDTGYVAIHDAVRIGLSNELIEQGFNYCQKYKACIPVVPIEDTVKVVRHNIVKKTLDRSKLCLAQTPQFFEIGLLKRAYQKAYQDKYYATDDAQLLERIKVKIYTIPGAKLNLKITDRIDLEILKHLKPTYTIPASKLNLKID
ncbi:MAG: 2-C-methyl-D-erythritol 4-phosphate cytidylyltransferase [candidate division WOR-3 bacterium]|nr:2-C-methyl-D-erythritol 4-phosphate cytidylyltransferase [candidate division WOR-3 bacterium]